MTAHKDRKPREPKPKAEDQDRGVRCPSCRCGHHEVYTTRKALGGIRRVRICRFCGRQFSTYERTR